MLNLNAAGPSPLVEGTGAIPLLVIAPSATSTDQEFQRPLTPQSLGGSVFTNACSRANINREQIRVFQPTATDDSDYRAQIIAHLAATSRKPSVLLALGDQAIRVLTGHTGKKRAATNLRGYILDPLSEMGSLPTVATLDPAFIIERGAPNLRRALAHDIGKAVKLAQGGGRFSRPDTSRYELFPPLERLERVYLYYKSHLDCPIYYDIETRESFLEEEHDLRAGSRGEIYKVTSSEQQVDDDVTLSPGELPWDDEEPKEEESPSSSSTALLADRAIITQIQFSTDEPDLAVTVTWCPEVAYWTRLIFALPNLRVNVNNRNFDDPILRASGIPLSDRYLDLMNLYHRVDPDLPMGLQSIASYFWHTADPWKHLSGSDPGIYGCYDVVALQKIHLPLLAKADRLGVGTSFRVQDMQLAPALDRMQDRGYPCDNERKDAFGKKLDKYAHVLLGQMRKHYPTEILPYDPKLYEEKPTTIRKGFTEEDLIPVEVEVDEILTYAVPRSLKGKTLLPEVIALAEANTLLEDVPPHLLKYMKGDRRATCRKVMATRWRYRKQFNPGSRDQILAYLQYNIQKEKDSYAAKDPGYVPSLGKDPRGYKTHHVWEVPKNPQDLTKDWVGAKGLERLMRRLATAGIKDPILHRAVKRSKITKMKSSFVDGWKATPENLVHTTYKFNPATGQLAAVRPNVLQSPKHGALAKKWQQVIRAHSGRRWVTFDFSGFHALTTGFEANDPSYIRAARIDIHGILGYIKERLPEWEKLRAGLSDPALMSDQEIAERVKKWARANAPVESGRTFKQRRDEVYKRCIAEGSLVLTDQGEVPIEKITLAHRLWDGVEWVSHEGLIDQGIRSVITYDGLTATPDHVVFTEEGESIPLGRAASQMDRLMRTGASGAPIRTLHRDRLEISARQRIQETARKVRLWERRLGRLRQFGERRLQGMQKLRSLLQQASKHIRQTLRCYQFPLHQANQSLLAELWRAWNRESLQLAPGICTMGGSQSSTFYLQRRGDRSNRQQWPLRTREFETGYAAGTGAESTHNSPSRISRHSNDGPRICNQSLSLSIFGYNEVCGSGANGRGDYRTGNGNCGTAPTQVEKARSALRRVRVFDIANAGPRRCFTVSDCLVQNCVLGVQFGMKARKMYNLAPETFLSESIAQGVLETEQSIWPRIFAYQDAQRVKAASPPYSLLSPYGYIRHFTDVFSTKYDPKSEQWRRGLPGKDSEKVVAFVPANDAFGHIRDSIIWLDTQRCPATGLTWAKKFCLVNNVHDSLEFHCPSEYAEECLAIVAPLLQRRNQILRGPAAPDGLWCGVEAHVGQENEGMDTCQETSIISGPIDMPIELVIGWPASYLEQRAKVALLST